MLTSGAPPACQVLFFENQIDPLVAFTATPTVSPAAKVVPRLRGAIPIRDFVATLLYIYAKPAADWVQDLRIAIWEPWRLQATPIIRSLYKTQSNTFR